MATLASSGDAPQTSLSAQVEPLGEDIRADSGDLAEQVIDPLWAAEQRLDHQ
jgi:hypothetical protein